MRHFILHIVVAFLLIPYINGQTVGLVLSGGGAKGIAHIGVIKVLEENNIPIDFIAGTSMGAIVGGLYASGYTPDEMLKIISSDDFKQWTHGDIDICDQYYYKTKDESSAWFSIDLESKNGELKTQLPTHLISPAQMDLRFMQFYGPAGAAAHYDFNQLMVPYFCMATDVYKNEALVLDKGNLSSAVRASMTFPGYFKPIIIDSTLLFDGGMENNFPLDVLIEKYNPDFILGSKVANNPPKPNENNVYRQLANVFMKSTNYKMPDNGILIEPNVKKFSLFDIEHSDTIFNLGVFATEQLIDSIKNLIPSRKHLKTLKTQRQNFKAKQKPIEFNDIEIHGVNLRIQKYISHTIMRNRKTISFDEFEKEYFRLLSDPLIEEIYPTMQLDLTTGYYKLKLDIKSKTAFTIDIGGNLSSNLSSMGYIGINYSFQQRHIYSTWGNIYLGKFYNSVHGQFRIEFPPRYPKNKKPNLPFFIELGSTYNKWDYFELTSQWTIDSDAPTEVLERESNFTVSAGHPVKNRGIISLSTSLGQTNDEYYHTNSVLKSDSPDQTFFNYFTSAITYEYNSFNYKQYANKGRLITIKTRYTIGDEDYIPGTTANGANAIKAPHNWFNIKFNYEQYVKICKYFSIGFSTDLNYSNKSAFNNSMSTLLSSYAYYPIPQSKTIFLKNYRSFTWIGGGLSPIIHITNKLDFRSGAFIFQPYQYILTNSYEPAYSEIFPKPKIIASAGFIYQTLLGPFAITGSYFMDEETELYFQVSFGYILFNNVGLN